jgi:hypothetical protein
MARSSACLLIVTLLAGATACGGDPTSPSGGSDYTGQWSGTTAQGTSILFTVSADQVVTSITVGYDFNGCKGSNTFSNLSLPIGRSGFGGQTTSGSPVFGFGSGSPENPNFTQVEGTLVSDRTANGSVTFLNFSCGNTVALWNATKR